MFTKELVVEARNTINRFKEMDTLIEMLKELMESKFYGSLELKWEAGNIVIVKKTESIKLS